MSLVLPLVAGATHQLLARGPDHVRQQLLQLIKCARLSEASVSGGLAVLALLGLIRWASARVSDLSANAFRFGAAPGWNWPSEVAIVTGGSSGIGLAITERFLAKGIKVAVLDMQPLKLKHANVRYYQCDVTSPDSVAQVADAVRRDLGHPSILVNNAGIALHYPILSIPHDKLNTIFGVNTTSHWTLCKQFLPAMIEKNKGHVVTVASVASFVALAGAVDYSCTKASALAFHEGLTTELKYIYKAPNVLTTVVHPNFVATPLVANVKGQLEASGVKLLTVDRVAGDIVNQVFARKGAQLIIPESSGLVSSLRGWPTWMQNSLRDKIGKQAGNK